MQFPLFLNCENTSTMAESEGKDIVICGDSFVKRLKYYCELSIYLHLNTWKLQGAIFQLSYIHITMSKLEWWLQSTSFWWKKNNGGSKIWQVNSSFNTSQYFYQDEIEFVCLSLTRLVSQKDNSVSVSPFVYEDINHWRVSGSYPNEPVCWDGGYCTGDKNCN